MGHKDPVESTASEPSLARNGSIASLMLLGETQLSVLKVSQLKKTENQLKTKLCS